MQTKADFSGISAYLSKNINLTDVSVLAQLYTQNVRNIFLIILQKYELTFMNTHYLSHK